METTLNVRMFSMRIFSTDHYMASPLRDLDVCFSDFKQAQIQEVPIFRIFGASPFGQKTCMHIHGVFPYFYVPFDGTQPFEIYLQQFANSLDKAINIAQGCEHSDKQHVFKVLLVSGIPMYGYHEKEQPFLKIYLYNPNFIRRAAELLLSGSVMNTSFQPHESHIPYQLQLFIDYNLYGMNFINVASVKFRQWNDEEECDENNVNIYQQSLYDSLCLDNSVENEESTSRSKYWHKESLPVEMMLDNDIHRASTCELEVDVVANDILNKFEVKDNLGTNPGLVALWDDARQRKANNKKNSEETLTSSPDRPSLEEKEKESQFKEMLMNILVNQDEDFDIKSSRETESVAVETLQYTPSSIVGSQRSQELHDEPLVYALADLAKSRSSGLPKVNIFEEQDSILSMMTQNSEEEDVQEEIEMSQVIFNDGIHGIENEKSLSLSEQEGFDESCCKDSQLMEIIHPFVGGKTGLKKNILSILPQSHKIQSAFPENMRIVKPICSAPSLQEVRETSKELSILQFRHLEPLYSNKAREDTRCFLIPTSDLDSDVAEHMSKLMESGIKTWRQLLEIEDPFLSQHISHETEKERMSYTVIIDQAVVISPCIFPPKVSMVEKWMRSEKFTLARKRKNSGNKKIKDGNVSISESETIVKEHDFITKSPSAKNTVSAEDPTFSSSMMPSSLLRQVSQVTNLPANKTDTSQIEVSTPLNTYGFRFSQNTAPESKSLHQIQYLTLLSIELHVETRGQKTPDPEFDPIIGIFYCVKTDIPLNREVLGVILANRHSVVSCCADQSASSFEDISSNVSGFEGLQVVFAQDEIELFQELKKLVLRWDPDILVGYETQMGSIGYLVERGSHLGRDLCAGLSRVPDKCMKKDWMADDLSDIVISGRIILNLWRIIKHEIVLRRYTLENVVFHILHERIPKYSFQSLTNWFNHEKQIFRWRVIDYYTKRTTSNLDLMDRLNLIGRTSEFARVFGIEFYHVLSRGSQYRVESMMLRLAKPLNFIPISPNDQQRAKMKAPECIPLTLEPEAKFYSHPVVVLDFQSLYPSIMIAYNYCFSTCLGRLVNLANTQDGAIEFGCSALSVQASLLRKLKDDVTISPNGVVFVKQYVRKGIISSMVEEILNTRLMVKKELKECKNKGLLKLLDARQLGLKLIANVTYGYTGANFSGRMPCIEVGDSIVRKARETLERAIELVENSPKWGAKVVYGDTDSMFIELQGRTKDEAFRIGHEIAEEVTMMNPKPVKLKFEKVYLPCILQAKKRYFGFMYEKPEQEEPVFDAKGVETVRRDNCEAASKILEKSIKILFTTKDISRVKEYVIKQCIKLLHERISIQDCVFAKEYRGLSGYKPGARVPALEIAKKLLRGDRRAEPRVGERVPYVIVYGSPGLPLIQLIKQPMEVVRDPSLHLNTSYYITKQILPPLQRFLSLLGTDALSWYQEMPRIVKVIPPSVNAGDKKATISEYFGVVNCPGCGELTKRHLCVNCQTSSQIVMTNLKQQICQPETIHQNLTKMCASCMGVLEQEPSCISLDCPVQFRLNRAKLDCKGSETLREVLCIFFEDV